MDPTPAGPRGTALIGDFVETRALEEQPEVRARHREWPAPSSVPAWVRIDADRSLVAWSQGSTESGLDVYVVTVGSRGERLAAPVLVAHEGAALGEPAIALLPSGQGVVAFLDSYDRGFRVLAATLDCGDSAASNGMK